MTLHLTPLIASKRAGIIAVGIFIAKGDKSGKENSNAEARSLSLSLPTTTTTEKKLSAQSKPPSSLGSAAASVKSGRKCVNRHWWVPLAIDRGPNTTGATTRKLVISRGSGAESFSGLSSSFLEEEGEREREREREEVEGRGRRSRRRLEGGEPPSNASSSFFFASLSLSRARRGYRFQSLSCWHSPSTMTQALFDRDVVCALSLNS